MNPKRLTFAIGLLLLNTVAAAAERVRDWRLLPDTLLTFDHYFEPYARVDTEKACLDICLKDARCSGWVYYRSDFVGEGPRETWEPLRRACVIGQGINERQLRRAPGRTAGEIRLRGECPELPGVDPYSYMC